jgi:hypothetical protein
MEQSSRILIWDTTLEFIYRAWEKTGTTWGPKKKYVHATSDNITINAVNRSQLT